MKNKELQQLEYFDIFEKRGFHKQAEKILVESSFLICVAQKR